MIWTGEEREVFEEFLLRCGSFNIVDSTLKFGDSMIVRLHPYSFSRLIL